MTTTLDSTTIRVYGYREIIFERITRKRNARWFIVAFIFVVRVYLHTCNRRRRFRTRFLVNAMRRYTYKKRRLTAGKPNNPRYVHLHCHRFCVKRVAGTFDGCVCVFSRPTRDPSERRHPTRHRNAYVSAERESAFIISRNGIAGKRPPVGRATYFIREWSWRVPTALSISYECFDGNYKTE